MTWPSRHLHRDRGDLHPYQRAMVRHILDVPRCALWVDMGLGKTVATLTALVDLLDSCTVRQVLIIAPKRVARITWPDEIRAWDHTQHLEARVIEGPPRQRAEALRDPAPVHIISRDLIAWLIGTVGADAWPYDAIVIDEASSFKTPSSQRFRALRKVAPVTDRIIELTGTPAPNGLADLWPQIWLLDQGRRLGRTQTAYRQRWFTAETRWLGGRQVPSAWRPRDGAQAEIEARIQDVVLSLAAADHLTLPPRVDRTIQVNLPAAARDLYRDLKAQALVELESEAATLAALSAGALSTKLRQAATGWVYADTLDSGETSHAERPVVDLHTAKLDALETLVERAAGQPVLVATAFRSDAPRIRARLPQARVLDAQPETVAAWNRGEIPVLLAHPASAGHGLNLQAGGAVAVWFGLTWSLEEYQQFNARLHRQGQRRPVVVYHLVAADTVDELMIERLAGKHATQAELLAALRAHVEVTR